MSVYRTIGPLVFHTGRGGNRGGGGGGRMMPDPQPSQARQPAMVQSRIEVASPYRGWKLYFPEEGL